MNTTPKLSLTSNCLERSTRPQIACGSSLQESPESLESNQHKVQWAARCWKTLGILSLCQIRGPLLRQGLRELFPKVQKSNSVCHAVQSRPFVPNLYCTSAILHRCIEAVLVLALLIFFFVEKKRKICATRHLDFLIRLAVLFARLQIRESSLGPLRPERSFRCPASTPTVGLAMCSNKLLARLPQLMNVRQIAMLWVLGDVRCHRESDPTKRIIVLNCMFLILSQASRGFLPQGALRVHRAAGDSQFKL